MNSYGAIPKFVVAHIAEIAAPSEDVDRNLTCLLLDL